MIVGGLDQEKETLRRLAETAWKSSGGGALLHGPPGTGKTLLAKWLAQELNASLFTIDAGDVASKFVGEGEAVLKRTFQRAEAEARALLFIDEIDAVCPKEATTHRWTATLVSCMDTAPHVFVLAATNSPHTVDPALRRPGRFDREIAIGIPSKTTRRNILQAMLDPVPKSVTLEQVWQISDKCHGFVGADLAALVREAGLKAVRRKPLEITFQDLMDASKVIKPSTLNEVAISVPHVKWTDIGGQEDTKQRLREAVEWSIRNPEVFLRMGIKPPKGILLYGPPGCAKTMMAKALATESGANFIAVKGPELFSKWVGDSEKAVAECFRKARAAAPCVVFFDEVDAVGAKRQGTGVSDRVLTQLLTELDGVGGLVNVTFLAATNRPDVLDAALLRPGRIDRICYVGLPDLPGREAIFTLRLAKMATDVAASDLAEQAEGYSGAECVALCQEAALMAMERDVNAERVTLDDFRAALRKVRPRTDETMLRFYQAWARDAHVRGV